MHSETRYVQQLCQDVRNRPAHVSINHSSCNREFCKHHLDSCSPNATSDPADNEFMTEESSIISSFSEQVDVIISQESSEEPTFSDEIDAQTGGTSVLDSLIPEQLFAKVLACGDCLVMLAPQLGTNQTSNLAKYRLDASLMVVNSTIESKKVPLNASAMLLVLGFKVVVNGQSNSGRRQQKKNQER